MCCSGCYSAHSLGIAGPRVARIRALSLYRTAATCSSKVTTIRPPVAPLLPLRPPQVAG